MHYTDGMIYCYFLILKIFCFWKLKKNYLYDFVLDKCYINIFDGKLYIQTGKSKDVSKQIQKNPKVEICCFDGQSGRWLRLAGELSRDDRREPKVDMLEHYPDLKNMYSADDDNTEVLYFKNATATIASFAAPPKVITF